VLLVLQVILLVNEPHFVGQRKKSNCMYYRHRYTITCNHQW